MRRLWMLVMLMMATLAELKGSSNDNKGRRFDMFEQRQQQRSQQHQRRPLAWGEWELEDDYWESLGSRFLDWILRRQPPEEPHPLRMQRWTIHMHKVPFRSITRHMQFYPDGTCEVEEEIRGKTKITANGSGGKRKRRGGASGDAIYQGKWKYDKYGLNWELEELGLRHFYHAELIWHSFGDRPKMHCGVIVRNWGPRALLPPWLFRPVVGTFHGLGNGTDTYLAAAESGAIDGRFNDY